ncbi:uncharacterized protein LOC117528527 [Thalassophryne amazonica]|uniref:uncharacterized protein LOC117528527 n=1 Tax=Thalassophryne amazonica TaxID=390379 RepID=UPI001470C674|nr:uncharacterized protein LOC117528527 [Thalassophryne amazonica]
MGRNMSVTREKVEEALSQYVTQTLTHIETVTEFLDKISKWMLQRETELNMMIDINDRATGPVSQSEGKWAAFVAYMKHSFNQINAEERHAKLSEELAVVVKHVLEGLEELDCFLDAVERLAVTSRHIFMEDNQVLDLPERIRCEDICDIITAAGLVCPLLLQFQRDANVFFSPNLHTVVVLIYQLNKYIQTTQKICTRMKKSCTCNFSTRTSTKTLVSLTVDLSEDELQWMLSRIDLLTNIRLDQHFQLGFMFQVEESQCSFISEFSQREPRMLQFLQDLEESAVQLDKMKKGAKISSVAGSSIGAVGGVFSIVGLALIPFTAGASLALTMTGVGLGVTSAVNSTVTTATEIGVNRKHTKKSHEVFESFMEDVQALQRCLEEVYTEAEKRMEESPIGPVTVGVVKVVANTSAIGRGIDLLVDAASAAKVLRNEKAIENAAKVAAIEGKTVSNVATDIPEIGQAALKGPFALSKTARVSFIALNALFLGMDVFFICKDSISLAKGIESEVSQFIRARSALWRSEMDSWKKICESLCQCLLTSEKNKAILEMPFYPKQKKNKPRETKVKFPNNNVDETNEEIELCVVQ